MKVAEKHIFVNFNDEGHLTHLTWSQFRLNDNFPCISVHMIRCKNGAWRSRCWAASDSCHPIFRNVEFLSQHVESHTDSNTHSVTIAIPEQVFCRSYFKMTSQRKSASEASSSQCWLWSSSISVVSFKRQHLRSIQLSHRNLFDGEVIEGIWLQQTLSWS